jgi:AAA15 family ATPase/GTPase
MKYIKRFFLVGLFASLISSNALSQEKPTQEKSNTPKETVEKSSKEINPAYNFIFTFFCSSISKNYKNNPPVIGDLKLDKTELSATDSLEESERILSINVFTDASDPDGDVLDYKYDVSGGKIIGQSRKVIWDLTGVEAGTYTIKVSADDGCGICGNTITKTVIIK